MPRLVKRLPKYRKHAGGQAVVTLNGRDFYLSAHKSAASRREYERLTGEWLSNNRLMPAKAVHTVLSFDELILAYWSFAQEYYPVAAINRSVEYHRKQSPPRRRCR